MEGFKKSY